MTTTELFYYSIPIYPIIVRAFWTWKFRDCLYEKLSEKELDRNNIRNIILVLQGFSFTALTALILIESKSSSTLNYPIYFTTLSFIQYIFAFNVQGYKSKRWQEIVSDTLLESGTFCLLLTIISLLFMSNLAKELIWFLTIISGLVWFSDFLIRLNIQFNYLKKRN